MKSPFLILLGILIAGLILISNPISAQNTRTYDVPSFNKIISSPYINLVLKEGNEEKVTVESKNVDERYIRADVDGNTLRIYLDGARLTPKYDRNDRWGGKEEFYKRANVTATVTYKELKKLSVRGDEWVRAESPIKGNSFKVKIYGDNRVFLSSVESTKFKAALYGDNKLEIDGGTSEIQKYRSFGDNEVEARQFESPFVKTSNFGDSEFRVNASDVLVVTSFGDSEIRNIGNGYIEKGIVLGDYSIR